MDAPEDKGSRQPGSRPPRRSQSPLRYYLALLVVGFVLVVFWDEIGFFLFLLLLGGVLSYLGDQLGSYCGKQRLSLFGLRPKYTAGLINLGTGVTITMLTFGGAVWMSEDVRVAVFRVSELRQNVEDLRQHEGGLRRDIEKVRGELEGAKELYQEAVNQRQEVERERVQLLAEKAALSVENSSLTTRNASLVTSNDELEKRREDLGRSIQEKLVEIDRLNLALEKKETAPVVISRRQVLLDETAAVPMDVTTEALQQVIARLTEKIATRVQLLGVKFDQRSGQYLTRFGVERVLSRLKEIEAFYRAGVKQGKLEEARVPRECHISPISTRNVSVGERLARVAFDVRPNLQLFARGDEVARTLVDGSLEPGKVLDQMLYFDQQVRTVLREKGVSPGGLPSSGAGSDPERLLQLVRVADRVHATGKSQVVRCEVAADVFAFGGTALRYLADLEEHPTPSVPATSVATGALKEEEELSGFQIPSYAAFPYYAPQPREPDTRGSELILPEPTLLADSLPSPGLASVTVDAQSISSLPLTGGKAQ